MKRISKSSVQKVPAHLFANIDWQKARLFFDKSFADKKSTRRFPSVRVILSGLVGAGEKGLVLLFEPRNPATVGYLLSEHAYHPWEVRQVVQQLKKQRYISMKEDEHGTVTITITKQGISRALTYQLDTMRLEKPAYWDKKWRVVIFDIPTKYPRVRDLFRTRLRQLGLFRLQESVFVSPYRCFDEVEFLRELYGVPFSVRYLLVEKIEDDAALIRHFGL